MEELIRFRKLMEQTILVKVLRQQVQVEKAFIHKYLGC